MRPVTGVWVWISGFRFRISGVGFRVLGFRVSGFESGWGFGSRVSDFGFRVLTSRPGDVGAIGLALEPLARYEAGALLLKAEVGRRCDELCTWYRGYSKVRTRIALGPYSRASPRSIGPP